MVFAYYKKLSKQNQAIYRKSDAKDTIQLSKPELFYEYVRTLEDGLELADRRVTENTANSLLNAIADHMGAPKMHIRVLSSRPSNDDEELHGLYEPVDINKKARITVWMRTAKHKKVVAFRSFLRTLLHEFCHHLDYEYYLFEDSFHTEGFFKREAHLFRQLLNEEEKTA
jgi:hypothetical protein